MKRRQWIGSIIIVVVLTPLAVWGGRHLHKRYQRYVCGENLKRLTQAQAVYANDYDDEFIMQGQPGLINWFSEPNGF